MKTRDKILSSAAFAATLVLTATAASAETKFIANSFYGDQHPLTKYTYTEWAASLVEISGGDLVPEVYTGSVLLAPRANLQGAEQNVVQVANIAAVYTPSDLPVANAIQELGFSFADPLAAAFAVTEFSMHNPVQLEEWKAKNLVFLGGYSTPPYILFCKEPVTTLAEIKGKRIRTSGSSVSKWVESVDAIPVNVPSSEMYTGLERGTLDCATNAANDLIDRSLWEVAPHTTNLSTGMYWSGPVWGFNQDFWSSLSTEQRGYIIEASSYALANLEVNYVAATNSALGEAAAKGNTIHEADAELTQSANAFRENAIESAIETATTDYKITDPAGTINGFVETYKKWETLLESVDRSDVNAVAALVKSEIYDAFDPAVYGLN